MHPANPLFSTVILLASGVIGLAVARFAHISPIVGFFIIGAIIGPQALGLIDNHSTTIHFLSELGVCFLLFDIGLHISLKELRKGWKDFFAIGILQCIFVTCALAVAGKLLGLSWFSATILGAIFSLSSTALVLKILADNKEEASPAGKRATEILVFQDITAILLLVILSGDLSQGFSPAALAIPLIKMILAGVSVVVFGRIALKPLFRILISLKSDEVITAFALLLVFLASWATQSLGLSLALGAFLGGLALSESSYSYLVRGEISPFRSLLLSLFFLSVGLNLDVAGMFSNLSLLLGLLAVFAFAKILANFLALRFAKVEKGVSVFLSFLLMQGSEFAFVLLGLAATSNVIDSTALSLSTLLVSLSLAVTPLFASLGCVSSRSACTVTNEDDAMGNENDPREVIIVRIDEFGRQLAGLLEAERIPYRAHDHDLERLAYGKSRGLNVYFSDLHRPHTLGRVSVGKALAVVSLVEDDHILRPLLEGLQKVDTTVPVIAATENAARLELLSSLGVEQTFIKTNTSLIVLFEALIRSLGFDEARIEEAISRALQSLEPESLFPKLRAGDAIEAQALAA